MNLCVYLPIRGLRLPRAYPDIPPHCTLVYGELSADADVDIPSAVDRALRAVARGLAPFPLTLSGLVHLGTPTDRACCSRVYGVGTHQFRFRLLTALSEAGITVKETHDAYIPHVTLAKLGIGGVYTGRIPHGRITARTVRYALDGSDPKTVLIGGAKGQAQAQLSTSDNSRSVKSIVIDAHFASARFLDPLEYPAQREIPEGHTVGKPFVFAATGEIFDRYSGELIGQPITESDLTDALAFWATGEDVLLDFEHKERQPVGRLVGMYSTTGPTGLPSLVAVPAYSDTGTRYVAACDGNLYSSPHLQWLADGIYDAADGSLIGRFRVKALALTVDPAQAHRILTEVRLSENGTGSDPIEPTEENRKSLASGQEGPMNPEEIQALMAERDELAARVAELEEALQAMRDAQAEEAEMSAEDAQEDKEGAQDSEELSAEAVALATENASLRERVAALEASAKKAARDAVIEAALSAGKLTPAERETAEAVYDKGLFDAVYGSRKTGSMLPQLSGHGGVVEDAGQGSKAHKAVTAFLSSDAGKGHTYTSAAAHLEAQRPELFR